MPRQLLILTGELEAAQLEAALRPAAGRECEIAAIASRPELEVRHKHGLAGVRLLAFCTRLIVPPEILSALTLEPYNVHPGSPQYPGVYPEAYATYDEATQFAATAHVMAERVDTGAIVKTDWFDVLPGWGREQLAERSYEAALGVLFEVALLCIANDNPLPRSDETWCGTWRTRAHYHTMCQPGGTEDETARRRRAFAPDFASDPASNKL